MLSSFWEKALETILPKGIIYRSKKRFGVPIKWFSQQPLTIGDTSLLPLNQEVIKTKISEHRQQEIDQRAFLWNLWILKTWWNQVAELRCGSGEAFQLLGNRIKRGVGVDISTAMLERKVRFEDMRARISCFYRRILQCYSYEMNNLTAFLCWVGFITPVLIQYFMETSVYVIESQVEVTHWWFKGRRKLLGKIISKLGITKDDLVLDIGTGAGNNLRLLKELGFKRVIGMDNNEEAIHFCTQKNEGIFVVCPLMMTLFC